MNRTELLQIIERSPSMIKFGEVTDALINLLRNSELGQKEHAATLLSYYRTELLAQLISELLNRENEEIFRSIVRQNLATRPLSSQEIDLELKRNRGVAPSPYPLLWVELRTPEIVPGYYLIDMTARSRVRNPDRTLSHFTFLKTEGNSSRLQAELSGAAIDYENETLTIPLGLLLIRKRRWLPFPLRDRRVHYLILAIDQGLEILRLNLIHVGRRAN